MQNYENEGGSGGQNLTYFLLGAAAGAGIALLLAPDSGEKVRSRVRNFFEHSKDETGDYLSKAQDRARDIAHDADQTFRRGADVAEDVLAQAKRSSSRIADTVAHEAKKVWDKADG